MKSIWQRFVDRDLIFMGMLWGTLAAFVWIPGACPWFNAICFVPFWRACLQEKSPAKIFVAAVCGLTLGCMIGFYWIAPTTVEMFGFSKTAGGLSLVLFAFIFQFQYGLAYLFWALIKSRVRLTDLESLLLLSLILFLFELMMPSVLPFNFGYPWLWSALPLLQLGGVLGFKGLSLFTYVLNSLATYCWIAAGKKKWPKVRASLTAFSALVILASLWGVWLERKWQDNDQTAVFGYVQGNLPEHWMMRKSLGEDYRLNQFNFYAFLSEDLVKGPSKPDLIIWPENTLLLRANTADPLADRLKAFQHGLGIPILSGLQTAAAQNEGPLDSEFASAVLFRDGKINHVYNKLILVPFGEFIPWVEQFPVLKVFDRGDKVTMHGTRLDDGLFDLGRFKIGVDICFESLYASFSRRYSELGASILVNLASDSWFGQSLEPYQHAYVAMARAVEYRRPLLRIANTGLSALMTATGHMEILASPNVQQAGLVTVKFNSHPETSFYAKNGDWGAVVFAILIAFGIFLGRRFYSVRSPPTRRS